MGEIADMMIEGDMCQGCGVFIDNPFGIPGYCLSCDPENGQADLVPHDEEDKE